MTIEYFILKTWRYFSLIIVIIFLFLKYYALPDMVAVYFNQNSSPAGFLPRDQIFYLIAGILLLVNILPTLLITQIKKMPKSFYTFLPDSINRYFDTAFFHLTFENWINLIIGIINGVLLLGILILSKINSTEYHANINEYGWLTKAALISFVSIILYPIIKFRFLGPKADFN